MWWIINNLFKNLIENNKLKFINFYNKKNKYLNYNLNFVIIILFKLYINICVYIFEN